MTGGCWGFEEDRILRAPDHSQMKPLLYIKGDLCQLQGTTTAVRSSQCNFWNAEHSTHTHFSDHKRASLPLFALLLQCSFGRLCSFLPTRHLLAHSRPCITLHPKEFLKRHLRLIWKRAQGTSEINSFSRHFSPPNSTKWDISEFETATQAQWCHPCTTARQEETTASLSF